MHDVDDVDPHIALVARAAGGDAKAIAELVTALSPTIRGSVAGTLARRRGSRQGRAAQEVEDIAQGVLLALFAQLERLQLRSAIG